MSADLSMSRIARIRTSIGAWAAIIAALGLMAFAFLASWPISAVALAIAIGSALVSTVAFGRSRTRAATPTNTQLQQTPPAIIATQHECDS